MSDCKVSWGVSCQRWGRLYDHGLVRATFKARLKTSTTDKSTYNYSILSSDNAIKDEFESHCSQNMANIACNNTDPADSLARLREAISCAAAKVLPTVKSVPLRKRHVSVRTKHLYEQRQKNYCTSSIHERKAASTAITRSCREDYRTYIDGVLNDMEVAERKGNMREVTRLTKLLSRKSNPCISPSKDL